MSINICLNQHKFVILVSVGHVHQLRNTTLSLALSFTDVTLQLYDSYYLSKEYVADINK